MQNYKKLALFGGRKLFYKRRPIGQLYTPCSNEYLSLIEKLPSEQKRDKEQTLVERLEQSLCEYHQVNYCISVANAGIGITMLMQLFSNGLNGEVIMPAFTFRGLPHFAKWAGQKVRYCDIEPVTHCLDPKQVELAINDRTTSILAVCNFNSPGYINELQIIARKYNVPLFFDSVYSLGSTYRGKILGSFARAEVFSTHATKLLNGFEGGYITTNDKELAEVLMWQRDYTNPALTPKHSEKWQHVMGLNGKLNDQHAAMALLSLNDIDKIIAANKLRYLEYSKIIDDIPGLNLVPYLDEDVEKRNYQMAVVKVDKNWPYTIEQTVKILNAEGLAISPYYSPPLHLTENSINIQLPVTEELSNSFFQLPVGEFVSKNDIHKIGNFLQYILQQRDEILVKWHLRFNV